MADILGVIILHDGSKVRFAKKEGEPPPSPTHFGHLVASQQDVKDMALV